MKVICYNLNGAREQGAEVVVDGTAYATSNAEYTLSLPKGTHSVDYNDPDVYSQWLIVRNDLNGTNIQQKDVVDMDSNISIGADTTLFLLKIPKTWDMPKVGDAIDYNGAGLYKFKNSTIPMVVKNLYEGDASETKRLIQLSASEFNNSQIRGEFASERQKVDVRDYDANNLVADPRSDVVIKNIGPFDAVHGENFTGYEITHGNIEFPGNPIYIDFDTVVHEHIQGFTHQGNDNVMSSLHDGEKYNKLGKDSVMTYVNFTPGTRFKQ